jgi:hypothetical protein
MSNDKDNKKGVIIFGLAAAGAGLLMATRQGEAAPPAGGLELVILDEWGNPVPRSPAGRGPVGRGPVMAGTVLNLVPGNYSAQVTVHNTTTTDGVAAPATLTTVLSSDITGLISTTDPVAYTAGQTLAKTYPFTVTSGQIGQSGKQITVAIKDPNGVQLATDFATVNIVTPAIVLGAFTAPKLYSTSVPAGVAPGTTSSLAIKTGDAFWADLAFQYQYQGGNYTFLAEVNVGGVYLRSFKDMTLPNSATLATVNLTTANQDLFNPGSLVAVTLLDIRLSLIFRGFGADTSQWVSVLTKTYTGAATYVPPGSITKWEYGLTGGQWQVISDGVVLAPSSQANLKITAQVPFAGTAPTILISLDGQDPISSSQSVSATMVIRSSTWVPSQLGQLAVAGSYTKVATLKVNGVSMGTSTIRITVQSVTIYGAEVTIS